MLSLKEYFFIQKNLKSIPKVLLDSILKTIKNRETITKEFQFFKSYFKQEHVKTQEVEEVLLLMANKYKIQNNISSIIFFLSQFKEKFQNQTITTQLIEQKKELEKIEENNVAALTKANAILKSFGIDIERNQDFVEILNKVNNNLEFFQFIKGKTENDLRELSEFIDNDNANDNLLTSNDIQDMIKIINFINQLRSSNINEENLFLSKFKEMCNSPDYSKIAVYFAKGVDHLIQIKDLFNNITNKEEQSRGIIKELIVNSDIIISYKNENVECNVKVKNTTYKFEKVLEHRDIAILQKAEDNFYEFSLILNQIAKIIHILKDIYSKCYN